MELFELIWSLSKYTINTIYKYYTEYPCLSNEALFCRYYKKFIKTSVIPLSICVFSIFVAEVIASIMFYLNDTSWEDYSCLLIPWLIMNSTFLLYLFFCIKIKIEITQPKNKRNYDLIKRNLNILTILSFLATISFALYAYFISELSEFPEDLLNVAWGLLIIVQLVINKWITFGLKHKISGFALFNVLYCTISRYKGFFIGYLSFRIIIPIIICIGYFIVFNREKVELFMLEKMIKEQNGEYKGFLENVKEPILIFNNNDINFSNEVARNKFNITKDNYALRLKKIITERGDSLSDSLGSILKNPSIGSASPPKKKFYLENASEGTRATLIVTIYVSLRMSGVKTIFILLQDITSELELQHEIEAKYKNMLLFSLSHELRTPLNILQNFISFIKKLNLTNELFVSLKKAKAAWRYLRNTINDILDYSQILTKDFRLHNVKFSIRKFIGKMLKITYQMLQQKIGSIKLVFQVDEDVPQIFCADRERLEQILFNFLINAVKYTAGGVISINVKKCPDKMNYFSFEISDTGCGMNPETIDGLFKINNDLNIDPDSATKLVGFGLTIVSMLCDKMGTKIDVSSVLGKGSTFTFSLKSHEMPEIVVRKESSDVIIGSGEEVKIRSCNAYKIGGAARRAISIPTRKAIRTIPELVALIVDDTPLNRAVVVDMIKKHGFYIEEAQNGEEAITVLDSLQQQFSKAKILVFMDLDMPVMDGIEATKEIRKRNKKPVPFITALTAFASEQERIKCLSNGMDYFISKPITKDSLTELLAAFDISHNS